MREFELLQTVFAANHRLPASVTIPPGDDMGSIRIGQQDVLVTVDQVVDGVHVNVAATPLEKVGRKAVTRNLSDVAAMGAVPCGAVVAASLPRDFGKSRADDLFHIMHDVAASFDCPLIGGDTCIWDHPLVLTVTVLAEMRGIAPMLRSGAQPGDVICVTGSLGGSLQDVDGYVHHLDFAPRIDVARELARSKEFRPHCMIDLSDGLARDIRHICAASNVSAEIWVDRLPISRGAYAVASRDHGAPWQYALGDGEDYELCFTVSEEQARAHLPSVIDGVAITEVGVVLPAEDSPQVFLKMPDGNVEPMGDLGWEHRGS